MFERIFKVFFVVILVSQIFFNVAAQLDIIHKKFRFTGSHSFPGAPFLGLKPYLKGIHIAGYYSDSTPADPDISIPFMFTFQRAQFALAPLVLDHYDPLHYEHIVLVTANRASQDNLLRKLNAVAIVRINDRIVLVHRGLQ